MREPIFTLATVGYTPLHVAAEEPHLETVQALLEAGANVNADDRYGAGPLHNAANRGCTAVAAALLAAGADVDKRGAMYAHSEDERHNVTALHVAALQNALGVAELLLARGAEINATAGGGRTPLDEALLYGHADMQALLRRHEGKCAENCKLDP